MFGVCAMCDEIWSVCKCPCDICGARYGDEEGHCQDDRGNWWPVCSEACTGVFYEGAE